MQVVLLDFQRASAAGISSVICLPPSHVFSRVSSRARCVRSHHVVAVVSVHPGEVFTLAGHRGRDLGSPVGDAEERFRSRRLHGIRSYEQLFLVSS